MKKVVVSLAMCIGLLLLSQFFLNDLASAASTPKKTLKIGAIMPLSGKGATLGIPFRRTIIMQADKYNKEGGVYIAGERYKIELIIEDSRYSPNGAKLAAEKLIYRDKVKFILGPVISPACMLINPIAEEAKILHLNDGSSPKNIGPKYTYAFRPYLTSKERMPAQYKWIKENLPDVKKVGTIGVGDETGHATTNSIHENAKSNGINVCEPIYFPRGTSDFYPMVTKLLNMKPDYIDCGSGALGEIALIVRAARELGFKGYMSMSFPQNVQELCDIAGKENSEGFIFGDTIIAEAIPSAKLFKETYIKRWKDWNAYALKWSSFLPVMVESIIAAGTVDDTKKIRNTMEKMEYDTPMGQGLRWSGAKTYGIAHQIYTPYGMAQVKDCKLYSLGFLSAEKIKEAMGEK